MLFLRVRLCCHAMFVGKFAMFHGAASMRLSLVVMVGCLVMMMGRRHMMVFACGMRRMCLSL